MNKVKRKFYRNTPAFTMMAWSSFLLFVGMMLIGLYTLKEPLMVKGYYLMASIGLISSSFTVAKVVRDNQEDEDDFNNWKEEVSTQNTTQD
ncbi:hypothetical protein ABID29_001377 [Streptococcus rupicaprae]|uniref:YiaAB two helix domain-containing protein n=2 Tax=Streptococcus TaxID=1301 RepID=A0A7X6S261_9STRE|nr:YiaA/YiaB family inner membrane protein [Streptococcus ovuberis]NKZ21080.1 hypothetical protein [Streptococcus ovuberis]